MTIEEIRRKLKRKTVGIAGCGGLGSNCAVALARAGTGKLVVVDFDVVDTTNLSRQYYFADQVGMKKVDALRENIHRIDPGIKVETHDVLLQEDNVSVIFAGCDVIVEAFDQAGMKKMIIETVLERLTGTPLVCGIGLAGWGKNNEIRTMPLDHLYLCGDGSAEVSGDLPPLAPRVGIVACMEANQVLEILLGEM